MLQWLGEVSILVLFLGILIVVFQKYGARGAVVVAILLTFFLFAFVYGQSTQLPPVRGSMPSIDSQWTKVSENEIGDTFYIDFSTVKKGGGYVYYWELNDLVKPLTGGALSAKTYREVDCGIPRKRRALSYMLHKESMGKGTAYSTVTPKESVWIDPSPGSSSEKILDAVCDYAEKFLP